MRARRRMEACTRVTALVLLFASCTGGEGRGEPTPTETIPRGGTLRVELYENPDLSFTHLSLDPQRGYWYSEWELSRCCLLRTLLSYNGRPTDEGGTVLRPDLAVAMPRVSDDGLTWTFRLKRGLTYGPPFKSTEIIAPDIVRALEREARVGQETGYAFYYTPIEGFSDVMDGTADSISGLETPDDHTLVVHLSDQTGDLGYLFALSATAPIPLGADGEASRLGVAGEADYGRFLVSSGPYMVEGSEELDFSVPPGRRRPLSGFVPHESLTLVRNPSWDPRSDRLRPAYPDRIEVTIGMSLEEAAESVRGGRSDVLMNIAPPPQVPLEIIDEYRADQGPGERLLFYPRDNIRYMSMNLALPPLDDVHVRKAINLVVNKAELLQIGGGRGTAESATHALPDAVEGNLLLDYDPYHSPGGSGDVKAARREMALSVYDEDGDGQCDHESCRDVPGVTLSAETVRMQARSVAENLESIGIAVALRELPPDELVGMIADPKTQIGLAINVSWGKDFPGGSGFAPLFTGGSPENASLVGASPEVLERSGYSVNSVPSLDDKIEECRTLISNGQVLCWAEFDQLLMEQVVPWAPLMVEQLTQILSDRVVSYSFDQANTMPALDRIAVSPGGERTP
jgi:peptide/nickel transport system substrate-binding protein